MGAGLTSFILLFGSLSCTIKANMEDLSQAEISFIEPSANSYSNDTGYNFKVQISSNNKDINADKAVLQVYEGADCDPSKLVSANSLSASGAVASASSSSLLQDGEIYSARVLVVNRDKSFQSVCSPWVGIDTQNPNPVGVTYPTGNGFNSVKEFLAAWTPATDNGISGLSEVPYRLRLYGQASCSGSVLQKVDAVTEQYKFKYLTQGVTYSVQVSSVDKAGNESILSCSPYTEIDINVPGFTLVDVTSSDGYSRVTSPQVLISNDSQAAYWCFTPDNSFVPTTYTNPCPSGTGSSSGWYTSRPSALPIGSGDGLKSFNLWIVRSDGSLVSLNRASAGITLDQTPPDSFTVTGVGGLTDTIFDAYLTSAGQPKVKWAVSLDAVDYTVDIRTSANALVCSMSGVTGTDLSFAGCPVLNSGQTYKVRLIAFDIARNQTQAPDFSFTVDLDPPGAFSIAGVTSLGDSNLDAFAGAGNPTVSYGMAAGSSYYKIQIKDTNGITVCSLGTKADQSGIFNYAVESGVTCTGLMHGGVYRAYVSAFDNGENETQSSNNGFSFQVDTMSPTLSLDTKPSAKTSDTFANFTFTASDALSGLDFTQCQLDGGSYAACVSPHNPVGLSEGTHTFNVKAFDKAGNSALQTYTWAVDLTNPVLTIDSQPPLYTSTGSVGITFHASDASGIADYTCKTDGGSAVPCASPWIFVASEGSHTVVVRATDSVGFYDEKTVSFTVDTTDPTLTLTGVPADPSHSVTTGTVTFTMGDANPVTATCKLDGGSYSACTSPVTWTGLGAGPHTVSIEATDAAGNTTTQSTSWVIYTYSWTTGGFAGCTASQPSWDPGAWGSCSVAQPAYSYGGWGSCSATCGGGWQTRTETCSVVTGSQSRSVTCPVSTGTETRAVQCQRNDSNIVADTYCDAPSKPATTQSCSRGGGTDCAGAAPAASQSCSRGGGTDCNSQQVAGQSCNTQACCAGTVVGGYCWYLGASITENCNTTCASHGGYNSATLTYSGSSGSFANCSAVLAALSPSSVAIGDTTSGCGSGTGCTLSGTARYRCTSPATVATAVNGRRACACNN